MELFIPTESWLLASVVIILITTFPVKIGATLIGATNTSITSCGISVLLGIASTMVIANNFEGFIALLLVFTSMSIIYWLMLKPSFLASFFLTILVILIQMAVIQGIAKLGIVSVS